ncbi:MAG: type II toxin-antitoxin system VapC family toxin [Bryobacterales bacterium]|nr:type II toxin-antitoxin system VapC family toxin [Bryobacterales bacterium]
MLLDSSALICALMDEPEANQLANPLEEVSMVAVGAPMIVEAGIVLACRGLDPRRTLHGDLEAIGAEILEFRKQHEFPLGSAR